MKHIVTIQDNDLFVSIQDMADFSQTDYRSVQKLLRNYKEEFKILGLSLPKEWDFKSVRLNEPQATFLLTLMRNTEVVKRFKLQLVLEFYQMREKLCSTNRIELSRKETKIQKQEEEIFRLKTERLRTYKNGFMSLRKYLKTHNIDLKEEDAWSILVDEGFVENQYPRVLKRILVDSDIGVQKKSKSPMFNPDALNKIFQDYVGMSLL